MAGAAEVLDMIDGALRDAEVGGDAMRWSPDPDQAAAATGRQWSLSQDTTRPPTWGTRHLLRSPRGPVSARR
jgi:hypothetical protein